MLERRFHLEIRTPQKLIYEGDVSSVKAPGELGSFEILPGHIPFLTILETGEIRVRETDTPPVTRGQRRGFRGIANRGYGIVRHGRMGA